MVSGVAAFDLYQRNRHEFISAKRKLALGDKVRKDGLPGEEGSRAVDESNIFLLWWSFVDLGLDSVSFEVTTVVFCFPRNVMTMKSGDSRSALRQAQSTDREESQNIPSWKGPMSKDCEVQLLAPHSTVPEPGPMTESIVQTLLNSGRLGAVTTALGKWPGFGQDFFLRAFTFRILSLAANPETIDCAVLSRMLLCIECQAILTFTKREPRGKVCTVLWAC